MDLSPGGPGVKGRVVATEAGELPRGVAAAREGEDNKARGRSGEGSGVTCVGCRGKSVRRARFAETSRLYVGPSGCGCNHADEGRTRAWCLSEMRSPGPRNSCLLWISAAAVVGPETCTCSMPAAVDTCT